MQAFSPQEKTKTRKVRVPEDTTPSKIAKILMADVNDLIGLNNDNFDNLAAYSKFHEVRTLTSHNK